MSKLHNEEKMKKLINEAKNLINDIKSNDKEFKIQDLPQRCNDLTKYLFSHPYLLYSDLNEYFESSDVLTVLLGSLGKLTEQPKRDVLRLLHMLLHARRSLRDEARRSELFQIFLRESLEHADCWKSWNKFKHHINIASQLLVDRGTLVCSFNSDSVRNLVRKTIEDIVSKNLQKNEDVIPCVIFYACSMLTGGFENVSRNSDDEQISKNVLIKDVIGSYSDVIRDYIQDFKVFYSADVESKKRQYILYKPKSGYSFQQMCIAITYYSTQNNEVRMNIFQNGIYGQMNNLFSLKHVPESLLLCGIDILKLPILDEMIMRGVKNEFLKSLNEKLNIFLRIDTLTDKTKDSIKDLLKAFDAPDIDSFDIPVEAVIPPSIGEEDPLLIQITGLNINQPNPYTNFGIEKWGHLDVDEWLATNNLEELREIFSSLTGRGLKQLNILLKEGTRMQMIDFLMGKLEISFPMTLELIGALETL